MLTFTRIFGMVLLAAVVCQSSFAADPTPPPSHGRVFGHGSGVIGLDIDYNTGKVTRAWMLASTGHRDLDNAAIAAFRRAQFKPHTVRHRQVPITFRIRGRTL